MRFWLPFLLVSIYPYLFQSNISVTEEYSSKWFWSLFFDSLYIFADRYIPTFRLINFNLIISAIIGLNETTECRATPSLSKRQTILGCKPKCLRIYFRSFELYSFIVNYWQTTLHTTSTIILVTLPFSKAYETSDIH